MTRSLPPWTGKDDDEAIPARVRARVFEAFGGRCALSGRKIRPGEPWQLDHRLALALGGKHEEANLQPVLTEWHKIKSASDVKAKSKVARVRAKFLGVYPKSPFKIRSRPFKKREAAP